MTIKKTSRSTLVEQVTEQIEQMIESGQWKVGEKIPPEPELMEQFAVSRNTLREAIRSLVHAGMLETRQGIGTTIKSDTNLGLALEKKIQKSRLVDTLEVRLALEREAAQLAAERRTAEDLEHLRACLERCKTASEGEDTLHFADMDVAFHKAVVRATHNPMFIELYEHITDSLHKSICDIMSLNPACFGKEIHDDLFEAIGKGDPQLAVESVNNYLKQVKASMLPIIEQ